MSALPISDVRLTAASATDRTQGLLGFVAFRLGPVRIDGVTLRRTLAGDLVLSFPSREDRAGRRHAIVRPVDADARSAIEEAVLQALSLPVEGAS